MQGDIEIGLESISCIALASCIVLCHIVNQTQRQLCKYFFKGADYIQIGFLAREVCLTKLCASLHT